MLQYSVYARCAVTFDKKEGLVSQLKKINPKTGNIQCIFITDAQWKRAITLHAEDLRASHRVSKNDGMEKQLQFW